MELEIYTTNVELQDIPSYTTSITLEGQLLRLSFLWNERVGKRTLSIKNSSDECYLQNTVLHPNEPLELNSNAILDDLPYSVTLVKTGDSKRVGNIFDWSKDFILCFSRTVDLDVKKLNVVYGVTTPSTPILPKPFGNWILNQGFNIVGDNIRYTGYKTNNIDTYDSFALRSLQDALVKSFLDPDLQQYAAFTTAVEQLIGSVDWVLDPANNRIVYTKPYGGTDPAMYQDRCISDIKAYLKKSNIPLVYQTAPSQMRVEQRSDGMVCLTYLYYGDSTYTRVATYPISGDDGGQKSLPLETVASQVISNAESGEDEVLKLLSEDYINLVANSVFDSNPNKQFVKLEDLIPQLEVNKVLR